MILQCLVLAEVHLRALHRQQVHPPDRPSENAGEDVSGMIAWKLSGQPPLGRAVSRMFKVNQIQHRLSADHATRVVSHLVELAVDTELRGCWRNIELRQVLRVG